MHFELAEVSLLGDREENQDRSVVRTDRAGVLLVVADGMGGHAGGAFAAEVALDSLCRSFAAADAESEPRQFLQEALAFAHDDVVRIGEEVAAGSRPRATCAVCLVQERGATWAHVGDSRIYLAREGKVLTRTRDHTPIESLLQDGLISEEEIAGHPMRHYVEYCLGGFAERPLITVSETAGLEAGDIVLVCSDGLWSGVPDSEIGAGPEDGVAMQDWLARLAGRAVRAGTPYSDNTTVVALRVPVK